MEGYETTVYLNINSVRALLNKPSQLQVVREDPALIPYKVEELLCYNGPVDIPAPRCSTTEVALVNVVRHRNELALTHCYRPTATRTGSRKRIASAAPAPLAAPGRTRYTSLRRRTTSSDGGRTALGLLGRIGDIALDHTAKRLRKRNDG